jgi:hypothetical protein
MFKWLCTFDNDYLYHLEIQIILCGCSYLWAIEKTDPKGVTSENYRILRILPYSNIFVVSVYTNCVNLHYSYQN